MFQAYSPKPKNKSTSRKTKYLTQEQVYHTYKINYILTYRANAPHRLEQMHLT